MYIRVAKMDHSNNEFSSTIASLRGTKRSHAMVAHLLETLGVQSVSRQTVWRDEAGKTTDIPIERIRAYARIYKVEYDWLVMKWARQKYGVNEPKSPTALDLYPDPQQADLHRQLQSLLDRDPSLQKDIQEHLDRYSRDLASMKFQELLEIASAKAGFMAVYRFPHWHIIQSHPHLGKKPMLEVIQGKRPAEWTFVSLGVPKELEPSGRMILLLSKPHSGIGSRFIDRCTLYSEDFFEDFKKNEAQYPVLPAKESPREIDERTKSSARNLVHFPDSEHDASLAAACFTWTRTRR